MTAESESNPWISLTSYNLWNYKSGFWKLRRIRIGSRKTKAFRDHFGMIDIIQNLPKIWTFPEKFLCLQRRKLQNMSRSSDEFDLINETKKESKSLSPYVNIEGRKFLISNSEKSCHMFLFYKLFAIHVLYSLYSENWNVAICVFFQNVFAIYQRGLLVGPPLIFPSIKTQYNSTYCISIHLYFCVSTLNSPWNCFAFWWLSLFGKTLELSQRQAPLTFLFKEPNVNRI